ncbi:helix-hairpin-helix domain-containing protein [bacterium]|nr:helix-hairpin-helix domain-containing protein [bacterium]
MRILTVFFGLLISIFLFAKVNINTADLKGLTKIKGVGKATAQKIVDYRTKNGPFKSIEELMKVKGIGKKTFEKIKNDIEISVDSSSDSTEDVKTAPIKDEKAEKSSNSSNLIDINSASLKELTKLKGVGKKTAEKIVNYREKNGAFKSINDLTKVKGVSKKLFAKIKDKITVNESANTEKTESNKKVESVEKNEQKNQRKDDLSETKNSHKKDDSENNSNNQKKNDSSESNSNNQKKTFDDLDLNEIEDLD